LAQLLSTSQKIPDDRPEPARRPTRAVTWSAGVLVGVLLLAALALWFRYGTTVFFDMIAAGFAACF
jgi:hypothetical protein